MIVLRLRHFAEQIAYCAVGIHGHIVDTAAANHLSTAADSHVSDAYCCIGVDRLFNWRREVIVQVKVIDRLSYVPITFPTKIFLTSASALRHFSIIIN